MIDQMDSGLYNVEYHNKNSNTGSFDVSAEKVGEKYKISVSNIKHDGYVSNWQVKYKLDTDNNWKTSNKLEFEVENGGNYIIKVVHGNEIDLGKKTLNVGIELVKNNINKVLSTTDNTELIDEKENKIVLPAGFKIVVGATTVDKGIVIEDATETVTKGSQFVWVPVGTITKADGTTVDIELNRYTFDTNGIPKSQGDEYINGYYKEFETSSYGNKTAKSISDFKNSVIQNEGYYIGRYEARTATARSAKTDALTQITEKGTENVYNYVTQLQAAELSQNMYTSNKFTSDLMNSYAWDTAIIFIQNCGTNEKYSVQNSLNTSLSQTGTPTDVQCNIYDMASNIYEWTTETSNDSSAPCILRGGYYNLSYNFTSNRYDVNTSISDADIGFRPLLYL